MSVATVITIEKVGQRVYVCNSPFSAKGALKSVGCKWDGDRRQWWIGATKLATIEALVGKLNGGEITPAKPDPKSIELRGKCEYKGRSYYMGAASRDGGKVRLVTLPDANGDYLDFWADASAITVTKRYEARERFAGYGRGTVREYPTLGSIARFIRDQRDGESKGLPGCAFCGKRSSHLHHDLEDGLMKCKSCCDIPE